MDFTLQNKLLLCLSFLILFIALPLQVYATTLTPLQRAEMRYAKLHGFLTPAPLRKATTQPSLIGQLWKNVGPAILGSTGVIAGAAIAWYTLRKKNKAFTSYYQRIGAAQERFEQELRSENDKSKAQKNIKRDLTQIQEEAELTAAQRKLDQEQLTAIINKIDRILKNIL